MSGQPAARIGDGTVKGGSIVQGSAGVMIGATNGKACSTCPGGMSVGNPVNPMLGAKVLTNEVDLALSGDLSFIISRTYSSYQTKTPAPVGMFGSGWQTQTGIRLTVTDSQIILHDTSGRSLYFEALLEGGIGYSQSENLWIIRGGREELLVKTHALTQLWESIPLEARLDRNYYFVTNRILGPMAILGYISPYVPDDQTFLPQPLDSSRVLLMESDLFGRQIHYQRVAKGDSKGVITKITDGSGREYQLSYTNIFLDDKGEERDPKRNPNASIDAGYGRDAGLRLSEVYLTKDPVYKTVPIEPLVRYHYSAKGELIQIFDRAKHEVRRFQYDDHHLGRMTGHRYEGRPMTHYEYDDSGRVMKQHNPEGLDYHFRYEESAAEVEDSLGRQDRYEFEGTEGLKRLVKHTRKDGAIVRNEFDTHGRMITQYDAFNRKTEYSLDIASGLLIKTTTHDGREFKFNYNRQGQMTTRIAPNGQRSTTEYDDLGRMTSQVNAIGEKTQYQYAENSDRIETIIDPVGKEKAVAWTPYGQVASFTDCSGKTQSTTYDQWGNTIRRDYEEGLFEEFEYDEQDRLIVTRNATEDTTTYHYNSASDTIKVVLPDGRTQESTYNAWGALLTQNFAGGLIQYQYDRANRLTSLTNENQLSMAFEYDLLDRTIYEKGFDAREKRVHYDLLGRVTKAEDLYLVTHFEYDEQDRLIEKALHHPNGEIEHTTLQYQDAGLAAITAKSGEDLIGVSYQYDKLGRMIGESQWVENAEQTRIWEYDVAHQYSKLGIKESSQYQGLPEIFYQTYGAGHFIGLLMDGESLIDFERDNLHRESERRFADLYLKSSYNERGELSKVTLSSYIHNFLNREYLYDKAGQLTTALTGQGEIKYRYDSRGRLIEAESYDFTQQYHYDFAGNLLPEAITPEAQLNNPYLADLDVGNRLESDNDFDYFYDDFGNLVRKYSKDLEESHYYQYDNQHRLIHYDRFAKNDKTVETDYRYDPLGRRIAKSSQKVLHGKVQPIETH